MNRDSFRLIHRLPSLLAAIAAIYVVVAPREAALDKILRLANEYGTETTITFVLLLWVILSDKQKYSDLKSQMQSEIDLLAEDNHKYRDVYLDFKREQAKAVLDSTQDIAND